MERLTISDEPIEGGMRRVIKGGKDRQKNRAKTFPGVAKAMAEQWAGDIN